MIILTSFYYLIASIILFFILNYLALKDKTKEEYKIIIPLIYIFFLASLNTIANIPKVNDSLFLIIIIEFILRSFYNSIIINKEQPNSRFFFNYILSIVLSIIINTVIINNVSSILPNEESIKIIIWILIILYLYNNVKPSINNKSVKEESNDITRHQEYIITSYAKYKNKYSGVVITKYTELKDIIFAIMIIESLHRSSFQRNIDNYVFNLNNKETKLGIMQIKTKKFITDEESINIVIKKLEKLYDKEKNKTKKDIDQIIIKGYYKGEYQKDALSIYNIIKEFNNLK